jgi:hypothetical protein
MVSSAFAEEAHNLHGAEMPLGCRCRPHPLAACNTPLTTSHCRRRPRRRLLGWLTTTPPIPPADHDTAKRRAHQPLTWPPKLPAAHTVCAESNIQIVATACAGLETKEEKN